MDTMIHQQDKR